MQFNINFGATIDADDVIDSVGFRMVEVVSDGNRGLDAVLFLIFPAQVLERTGETGKAHMVATVNFRDLFDLFFSVSGVALNSDLANAGNGTGD